MARAARKTGLELGLHVAGLAWGHPAIARLRGGILAAAGIALVVALATYNAADPSLNAASAIAPTNALGGPGATAADIGVQSPTSGGGTGRPAATSVERQPSSRC